MPDPSTWRPRRERAAEDPWTVVYRVVHDLRRDGIAVPYPDEHMPAAVRHAARLLWALGVAAVVPDERDPQDAAGVAQPGGGWISRPAAPPGG